MRLKFIKSTDLINLRFLSSLMSQSQEDSHHRKIPEFLPKFEEETETDVKPNMDSGPRTPFKDRELQQRNLFNFCS